MPRDPGTVRTVSARTESGNTGAVRLATGEAVEFEVRVARLGSRALALLVDIVLELVLFLILLAVTSLLFGAVFQVGFGDQALLVASLTVNLAIAFIGYPVLLETLTRGRTVGKFAVGLRTIRDDGGPVHFRHALTRTLVGVALEWPGLLLPPIGWLAGLWTMVVSPHGKRLGDYAAGTLVVHERSPDTWGLVPAIPPQLVGWAVTLDLTGLDDELALAVRHFLARNRRLGAPARTRLGYRLAAEVAAVITPPAPPGTPGWAFLAAVLAERNRRASARLAAARTVTATIWPELMVAVQPVSYQLGTAPGRRARDARPAAIQRP